MYKKKVLWAIYFIQLFGSPNNNNSVERENKVSLWTENDKNCTKLNAEYYPNNNNSL
jgi:hypothetical protein